MRHGNYRQGVPAGFYSDAALRRKAARTIAAERCQGAQAKLEHAAQLAHEAAQLIAPIIGMRTEWGRLSRAARQLDRSAERIASQIALLGDALRLPERTLENHAADWHNHLKRREG